MSIQSEKNRAARRVPCPACNARIDEKCTEPTDMSRRPVAWVHHARDHAAREAGALAPDGDTLK